MSDPYDAQILRRSSTEGLAVKSPSSQARPTTTIPSPIKIARHQVARTVSLGYGPTPSLPTGRADISSKEGFPDEKIKKDRAGFSWWWWWEIASAALSTLSMCLIVALLFKVDKLTLSEWRLPIQPNSLIAILTTIGKTAMLVPAASCLSQLKWRHFHLRPQPLHHLQVFDDGSRGPWGSLMLLFNIRSRSLLAWGFAVITLMALWVDPMAQQILEFKPRETVMIGPPAEIGSATIYDSKVWLGSR
jgi:hypothetical protein